MSLSVTEIQPGAAGKPAIPGAGSGPTAPGPAAPGAAAAPVDPPHPVTELVIEPRRGWIGIDWGELFRFRELLFFLVWRDVKVRYKQTVLGVAWAVLQPLFNMVIMTVIFGDLANFKSGMTVPFALWLYAGLLPWMLISTAITTGGMSLVSSQNLLTKIYFPRLFVPAAAVGGALVDMLISFGVFAVLVVFYGSVHQVQWTIVFLPLALVLTILVALGFAYSLAALTVSYRDFRFVIPFMAQALMYLSFVMIPLSKLRLKWQIILSLNPVFGVVTAYRAAIFGTDWHPLCVAISSVTAIGMFVFGLFYFRKTERRFADIA